MKENFLVKPLDNINQPKLSNQIIIYTVCNVEIAPHLLSKLKDILVITNP